MPGRKTSPNHGKLHGIRPKTAAPNFKKGEKRTLEAAHKGGQARKEQFARFKSLREAAEALRDIPSKNWPQMSNGVAAVLGVYNSASDGEAKALKVLAELMGEMTHKIEVKDLPTIVDDVPRAPDPVRPAPSEGGDA